MQTLNGQCFRDLTTYLTFQAFIITQIMSKITRTFIKTEYQILKVTVIILI